MKYSIYKCNIKCINDSADFQFYKVEDHFKLADREYYRILDANKYSRLLSHFNSAGKGAMIISASRDNLSEKDNLDRFEDLKNTVRSKGLGYISSVGGSKEGDTIIAEELSVIVPKSNSITEEEFLALAIELCKKYNQDSVLVILPGITGGKPVYYDKAGNVDMEFDDLRISRKDDPFYTKPSKNTTPKFSFITKDCYGVQVGEGVASKQLESHKHNALYYPTIIDIDAI